MAEHLTHHGATVHDAAMHKSDLAKSVAVRTGLPLPAATSAVQAVFDVMTDTLGRGEPVSILGFGSLDVITRAARTQVVFGKLKDLPSSNSVRFKAGAALKSHING